MRYLDPKNDLTFKRIFGEQPDLLKSFLNAILPLPEKVQIASLEYLPTEIVPELPGLKHSIVDVRCKDNFNRTFIVEMQMFWTDSFKQRIVFNAAKAYIKQIPKGGEYHQLQPVYALSLVNAIFEPEMPDVYYHHYNLVHRDDTKKQLEGLEFIFIELPKFKAKKISEKKLSVLWLRFLTEIGEQTEHVPKDLMDEKEISKALQLLETKGFSQAELEYYDRYWDSISTEKTLYSAHELKGKEEGLKEGEEIGIKKGEEIGIKKGEEKIKQIAKNLRVAGMPIDEISSITGLSNKDIEKL